MINDQLYMKIAYSILQRSIGPHSPNPTVVSLIVESDKEFNNNEIRSYGITEKGGRPHAEKIAIENLKFKSNKIYTLYSTLEPCCHKGREMHVSMKFLKNQLIELFIQSKIQIIE